MPSQPSDPHQVLGGGGTLDLTPGAGQGRGPSSPPWVPHRPLPTGYLLALGPLLFISICDVWLQLFARDQAYAINLAAVGTVAFGCTGREEAGAGRAGCVGAPRAERRASPHTHTPPWGQRPGAAPWLPM